jgi:hypothetical protein
VAPIGGFRGWMESPELKIFLVIAFAHRSVINETIILLAENDGCYVDGRS